MSQTIDLVGSCLSFIRNSTEGLQTFTFEAEGNEILYFDGNVEINTHGDVSDAVENLVKTLDPAKSVIVTYGQDTACVSEITHEAEVNDNAVYIWPRATDELKHLDPKIIESGVEVTQPQLAQLPRIFFLDEDGNTLPVEEMSSIVLHDPRGNSADGPNHKMEDLEDEAARENCVDDLIGAFFDSCLGGDYEDASIFITKIRLPNGKEVQSSVSRSRAVEKSQPVMAYHELYGA